MPTVAELMSLAREAPAVVLALLVWFELRTQSESLRDVAAGVAVLTDRNRPGPAREARLREVSRSQVAGGGDR